MHTLAENGFLKYGAAMAWLVALTAGALATDDLLIADFEGSDYGAWKTTGEAFGPGPARGTLAGQMSVSGFKGKGLVNSFFKGDAAVGTLTSPPLKIERRYINFLIGGGQHPGETCINLLVDGKRLRTASGPNGAPGGSEQLDWHTWDVADLAGREAVIEIVDKHTGGWGHINVDHIVQSDRRLMAQPARRELVIEKRLLLLPVATGAAKRRMSLAVDGKTLREFEIELAEQSPSFWVSMDASPWKGKTVTLAVTSLPADSKALELVRQDAELPEPSGAYREPARPQFHFTARRGWLNDPNGLVYHDGQYHLFFQHNPYGWNWGNMHWGHAVSGDMVHWRELPIALYPRQFGDWAFSGSAVVDAANTSGFKTGRGDVLVAAYTSTGRGECVVYSNDGGRTWNEHQGNPAVRHAGRDPRLVWHADTKQWVMAVYDEHEGKQWIAFYASADLKKWTFQSRVDGFFECPDLFELAVAGKPDAKRWVLYAADGKYILGQFDGRRFQIESGKHQLWFGNFYAAQTFTNAPGGRTIQIGWGQGIEFPGMPFNQQMVVPCELTLRETPDGLRMTAQPVSQFETLWGRSSKWDGLELKPGATPLRGLGGELFDVRATLELVSADAVGLIVRGTAVDFDVKKQQLSCRNVVAPLKSSDGKIELRILVDRGSVEVFADEGRVAMSVGVIAAPTDRGVSLTSRGGTARASHVEVHELKSAWD